MNMLLLAFAAAHLCLLVYSFQGGEWRSPRLWFLRAMLFAMAYDNALQAIGSRFIEAGWYEPASLPRFVMHAAVLPFLTPFAVSLMRDAGVRVAGRSWFLRVAWTFTLLALGWGLYHEVILLELAPKSGYGVVKLSSTSSIPPIATILTNLVILPMAAVIWRVAGWRWFFLAALFIFLVNGATATKPWGFIAGNCAELIFVIALLATHWHFSRIGQGAPVTDDLGESGGRITEQ